jgi:NADH dehydrogenase
LLDAGHGITVLHRSLERISIPGVPAASVVHADVTRAETLTGKLNGADAVVGAVQFPNHPVEVPRRGLTYDNFDRRGTENLVAEAARVEVSRFVYISGAGASTTSDKTWYRAKGYAEKAIRDSGIGYAFVRPSWAYGPEDRALNRLAAIARFSPLVPRLGLSPQRIQPVHVDDIALTVRRIFEIDDAWNKIYEVGGPETMTMDEVLRTLLDVMGKRRLVVPVPTPLAKLGTAPLRLLPNPPMTPQGVEFAVQDGLVDTSLLERVLGVKTVPLREGLRRYM